jgi:hypothetical protein
MCGLAYSCLRTSSLAQAQVQAQVQAYDGLIERPGTGRTLVGESSSLRSKNSGEAGRCRLGRCSRSRSQSSLAYLVLPGAVRRAFLSGTSRQDPAHRWMTTRHEQAEQIYLDRDMYGGTGIQLYGRSAGRWGAGLTGRTSDGRSLGATGHGAAGREMQLALLQRSDMLGDVAGAVPSPAPAAVATVRLGIHVGTYRSPAATKGHERCMEPGRGLGAH